MEPLELLELVQKGESSTVQFKERIEDAHRLSQELVAFSNTKGGIIVIGINDKTGKRNGLSYEEIQRANSIIVGSTTNNVKPSITVETETVVVDTDSLLIIFVSEGISKPYKDNNGAIWIKNGSDKRRVTSNEEIARLLQSSKVMFADEIIIPGTSVSDINMDVYKNYYKIKYKNDFDKSGIELSRSLQNQFLLKDGNITLAGLLLFCSNRHVYRPLFSIQCVSVNAKDLTGNVFEDNEPAFEGTLFQVYEQTISFINRNLKKIPTSNSFNSPLKWEIPQEVFEELIVNALIHRDYFINSTIKIIIYSDRIEIISPGKLPNSLSVENMLMGGISIPRNPVLQSLAQYSLPYKGLGTGVPRAIALYKEIVFINDQEREILRVIIKRPRN